MQIRQQNAAEEQFKYESLKQSEEKLGQKKLWEREYLSETVRRTEQYIAGR
jgi:hypothetical protein